MGWHVRLIAATVWTLLLGLLVFQPVPAAAQTEPATPAAVTAWPAETTLPEGDARTDGALAVVTTTSILADLVRQVGGARVDVRSLLPANADPHDYEPTPDDLVRIEEADAVFEHGLNLDAWADDLVAESGTDAPVFVATRDVPTLPSDEEGFAAGDPHVWFDPTRTATMVANIAADLASLDPDGAVTYDARRAAYQSDLAALDAAIMERVASIPPERRKLVTNHDALAYYADRYGLTVVGSIIPSLDSRAEPSAQETADLVDRIESEGVPAIFTESSLNPELARELAAQAGITVVDNLYTDSLGPEGSGADDYLGLMRTDTDLIVGALR